MSLVFAGGCGTVVAEDEAPSPRPLGAGCLQHSQCASEVCTAATEVGTCGMCVDAQATGAVCEGTQGCGRNARCEAGVCRSDLAPVGAGCRLGPKGHDEGDCVDEAACVGELTSEMGTCVARPTLGQACAGLPECVRGARCELGVCAARVLRGEGESCDRLECAPGLFCNEARLCAVATLTEGMQCSGLEVDDACVPGLYCFWTPEGDPEAPRTCLALPVEGEICLERHCAPGFYCEENEAPGVWERCVPRREDGEACGSRAEAFAQCREGLECRGETCRPACR